MTFYGKIDTRILKVLHWDSYRISYDLYLGIINNISGSRSNLKRCNIVLQKIYIYNTLTSSN